MTTIDDFFARPSGKLLIIAGPCVLESKEISLQIAETMQELTDKLGLHYIFKASFDKANRSSLHSYRGPGLEAGLDMLQELKQALGVPVLTDIHVPAQAEIAAKSVDMLQIPSFLCRQTDLVLAAAKTGLPLNIKKGEFLAPEDMHNIIEKAESEGARRLLLCERGTSFGYHNLVVDMASLHTMRQTGYPVAFDATHSVQKPGGKGHFSSGNQAHIRPLARAAAAVGINALFLEVHPDPEMSLSDGANMLPLSQAETLLREVSSIHNMVRAFPCAEE